MSGPVWLIRAKSGSPDTLITAYKHGAYQKELDEPRPGSWKLTALHSLCCFGFIISHPSALKSLFYFLFPLKRMTLQERKKLWEQRYERKVGFAYFRKSWLTSELQRRAARTEEKQTPGQFHFITSELHERRIQLTKQQSISKGTANKHNKNSDVYTCWCRKILDEVEVKKKHIYFL